MLNPTNDRLDYGQILVPPADFELDFAVGTTYSLDLDALTGASLALGLSEETDSALMNNPICLLEALRTTGDKVALFCEMGQIHLPSRVSSLYILLEKMVFCIKPAKRRGIAAYPSFHPKFWLLRYQNKHKEIFYRVIVLSRNLTFDHSWDVTFYMDGQLTRTETDKNEPVCDFLRYLAAQIHSKDDSREKSRRIKSIIKELPYIHFEPAEKEFIDYQFIPNGVKKVDGSFYQFNETPLFKDTFREALIISPFVSGGIIRDFNNRNNRSFIEGARRMLITRESSLGKLQPEDVSNFKLYTLKDQVIDGEAAISDEATSTMKQDIHAKVFMIRKYSDTDLYLGSLNASHNAVYGNVEFMIRLRAKNRYLNMDRLTESLFGKDPDGPDNPFQEVTLKNAIIPEAGSDGILAATLKMISRSNPKASVAEEGSEHYMLSVHFNPVDTQGFQVKVKPLLSHKEEVFSENLTYHKLTLTQLSEFFAVEVSDGESSVSRVLMIPTEGLPEDREQAVVSSVINDRDCFYRYVAFLLGDDSILSALEMNEVSEEYSGYANQTRYQIPALYEKMLLSAATQPEKFQGIDYLIKSISDEGIIPDDFKTLYAKFKKVVNVNG